METTYEHPGASFQEDYDKRKRRATKNKPYRFQHRSLYLSFENKGLNVLTRAATKASNILQESAFIG